MKLTFMGTAGARFMVAKQLAASGGLFLEDGDTRLALDPGPGAIVQRTAVFSLVNPLLKVMRTWPPFLT